MSTLPHGTLLVLLVLLAASSVAYPQTGSDATAPDPERAKLEQKLADAREDVAGLEAASPPAEPEALAAARRRVEMLEIRVKTALLGEELREVENWKTREIATNEQLQERLLRLKERFSGSARGSSGTRDLLKTNRDFVREVRSWVEVRLESELRDKLDAQLKVRSGIQDRLLQGSVPIGGEAPSAALPEEIRTALRAWYEKSNAVVQRLLDIDGRYAERLAILDETESFLLGYMYWVRDDDPLGEDTLEGILVDGRRVLSRWRDDGVLDELRARETWQLALLSAGFLALVIGGLLVHRRLSAHHGKREYRGGTLAVIAQKLLANVLVSAVAPVLLLLSTQLLRLLALPASVTVPVRILLMALAVVLFARRFFGGLFRPEGVAVTDMRAPPEVAAQLSRANRIVTTGLLVVGVPWLVLREFPVDPTLGHVPRLLLIALRVWVAVVLVGLLRRRGALVLHTTGGNGFWFRVAAVLGPLVVLSTVFTLVMDALGYRYGARLLSFSILQTFVAGIVLAGFYNLVTKLLDQAAARYRRRVYAEVGATEARDVTERHTRQVARLAGVTTVLLTVGLLAGFWELGGSIRGVFVSLRITPVDETGEVWMSAWDVLKALSWIAGGHFLVANLPGVLHVLLFSRTPRLQIGARFAIQAILKYVLLLVAYAAAILSLRMSFSSLGWALAAVSLGVGFGLQEIVSNFVSGLILFIERPVRVGDVVSVGTTMGTVEKINIRATEILNLDRQVIILPNRKFISEEVVNWTHNDLVIRVTVEVGVAYGTDVDRVREVLFEIVRDCELVRRDPEPRVWFREFGDSTLNVRVFAFTEYEERMQVQNDLNLAIARRFAEEGIEIAFPQRDLHLRTVEDPAVLRALPPGPAKETEPPSGETPAP